MIRCLSYLNSISDIGNKKYKILVPTITFNNGGSFSDIKLLLVVIGALFPLFVLLFSQSVSSYSRDILRKLSLDPYPHVYRLKHLNRHIFSPHLDPSWRTRNRHE